MQRLFARADFISRGRDAGNAAPGIGERAFAVGSSAARPRREVAAAIDRLAYYAGWTDKFWQVLGSVNPVATSHFNFTIPEPTGVVVALTPDEPALLGLISIIAPIIASGNSVVALPSAANALAPLTFWEIMLRVAFQPAFSIFLPAIGPTSHHILPVTWT